MDYEKLLIILLLFAFVAILFPTLVTEIDAISGSEPLKWLFNWIPYLFLGTALLAFAVWGMSRREG